MKRSLWIILLICHLPLLHAQELFLRNEPASSIPKHVLGVRTTAEYYNEQGANKTMLGLRLMYGLTSKLSVMANIITTNHHGKLLPRDLINHTHDGANTTYFTQEQRRGLSYDYSLPSINLYAKYRLISMDGENKHLRITPYAEYSFAKTAHDEAEPNLMDDTKGFGAGLITTYLYKKLAISFTGGFILPGAYKESVIDEFDSKNVFKDGFRVNTTFQYGRALQYNLSFGYLLFPLKYKNYKQLNVNLYCEVMGKSYEAAKIVQNNVSLLNSAKGLQAGNYIDLFPGLQFIVKSNLRIETTIGFPIFNRSYARAYPIYMLALQRYFYL
jgi:hypothetical protein